MPEEKAQSAGDTGASGTGASDMQSRAPDVTEEEELDIEIERATRERRRGGGWFFWTFLIVVLAIVVLVIGVQMQQQREAALAKERGIREAAYAAMERSIGETMNRAAELASKGEIAMAVEQLADAQEKWGQLAASANGAVPPDIEKAQYAAAREAKLKKAVDDLQGLKARAEEMAKQAADLEAKAKALAQQRDALSADVKKRILELAGGEPEPAAETGTGQTPQGGSQPQAAQPPAAAGK